ncbi:arylamine N-acetyltransferase family protein [Streptomyces sp. PR69]|uniref:arylamine N-acetyltransferase family protein n=1 Tax=Streptomyces sp. PR69 TaxID=2984950 RepID=UPI002B26565B|nr:arylamine N-acetyltransferase [Streptomyces sp. PR69]
MHAEGSPEDDTGPMDPMDDYLSRIGADRPERADAGALRQLQLHHLTEVPFENLSIHLGEDILLEEEALLTKIVDARRGGFCYELNGAFALLLRALGFRVDLLQARVFGEDGRLGIPYDHLALRVETADSSGPWLADVGFGDHSHYPLALDERGDQLDPAGTFRVTEAPEGDLDVLRDDKPQFRLETRPRELRDFTAGAWWHRTSPQSQFCRSVVCSRLTSTGRITISGRKLVTHEHGERQERKLANDAALLAAYRDHFGLRLDRLPSEPVARRQS